MKMHMNAVQKHRAALLSLAETMPDSGLLGDAKTAVSGAAHLLKAAENVLNPKRYPIGKPAALIQFATEFARQALAADPDSEAGEILSSAVGLLNEARERIEPPAPAGGDGFIQAWAGNLDFIAAELLGCKGEDLPHMLGQLPNRLKTLADEMRENGGRHA